MSAKQIRIDEEPSRDDARRLIDGMCADARVENRAIAARLAKIGELYEMYLAEYGEEKDCAVDTWTATGAEVASALRCSRAQASSYMHYAIAMRDALPQVAERFAVGDIDFRTFQAIVCRTGLIDDEDKIAMADKKPALRAPRWGSLSDSRLAAAIDRVVREVDRDAVRHRRERFSKREMDISDIGEGLYSVSGSVFSADGKALDQRLESLAGTVCEADPRTRKERRADALGALASGDERLSCRCGLADCPAGGPARPPNVTIHIVAEQAAVDGQSPAPCYLVEDGELISAEMVAELAREAKQRTVTSPIDAPPEKGYVPSRALADFVRCRDLTCRAPGCDVPAFQCDIDHTIPYSDGGLTHASNLKCQCRTHHLLKTFWGWQDNQLPDGTVIWTMPSGQVYVTLPGSAFMFPTLCAPTGELPPPDPKHADREGDARVMMPRRKTTRAENRAKYLAAERARNQKLREARRKAWEEVYFPTLAPADGDEDDDPPPF